MIRIAENKFYGVIYKVENKVNGKIYIGQTSRKNGFKGRYPASGQGVERIYRNLKNNQKYGENINTHLLRSIEKYGFENFIVYEKFDTAESQAELDSKEIEWIKKYKSDNFNFGYNGKPGGSSGSYSKEAYFSYCIKRNFINPIVLDDGRIYITIHEAERALGKLKSHFSYKLLKDKKCIPVICLTTCEVFFSATTASKKYNCDRSSIVKCCSGQMKHAGRHPELKLKLRWAYYKEYISDIGTK